MTHAKPTDQIAAQNLSMPQLFFGIAVGVFVGAFFWSGIRTSYYLFLEMRPEMSPMMFIVFAPIIAAILFVPAVLFEIVLCRFWWRPSRVRDCLALGFSYSFILIGLVEPWLLVLLLVANPIVLRLWFMRGHLPATTSARSE